MLNFVRHHKSSSPREVVDRFNGDSERVQLFAPTVKIASAADGKVTLKDRPLTFHYVFVKGCLSDVKELCAAQSNGFSFLLDHSSSNRYGIVSDDAMECFRHIASRFDNTLPFYNIENIDLEEGDYVEIVDGPSAGLRGVFMPKARSNRGNVVIAATSQLGSIVWEVETRYVRILRFAHNTRRQYDILDSFIPRLLPVMRRFHAGERLTDREKTILSVFCRRMEAVTLDNHKLEAKLLATLMCAQRILGDMQGLSRSAARMGKRMRAVTNVWTLALINLLLFIANGEPARLTEGLRLISGHEGKLTAIQRQITDEYRHYLPEA